MKIAHLTSAHQRYDTRIFLKMCRSLVAAGHDVTLIVADGAADELRDGVRILSVSKPRGRLDRMWTSTRRLFAKAMELDCDVYHLHDPELLLVALRLKSRGHRVIFDAHEDLPLQILSKSYIRPGVRQMVSTAAGLFERFACRQVDAVVAATPTIRDKFARLDIEAVDINNFPVLGEFDASVSWDQKAREVCYIGSIVASRGIRELVAAMSLTRSGGQLALAGDFQEPNLQADVEAMPGWSRVNWLGFLSRSEIRSVLCQSTAGLVTLHPTPAYLDSLPVKMFEYMSAGLPVIASNFPLWREIVEGSDCGICVDPLDPASIASAIDQLMENPDRARRMGENGQRAVHARYNWGVEEKKLLALYERLLTTPV